MKRTPLDAWIYQKIASNQLNLTRRDIEAWQLGKLNETLALVRERSTFYRQHFYDMPESLNHPDDLSQFPFTTAADVQRNPLQFVCVSQDEIQRVVTLQSSGTTGEPKRIYFTKEDQDLTIDFFGVGMSTLTEPGDKVLILLPCQTPGSVGDLLRIGLETGGKRAIPYGSVQDPLDALETMQNRQVDCLVGSPTQVLSLAYRWKPAYKAPRKVLLSTDVVPAAIVRVLEKIWGCEVFNHYGSTEMGLGGGLECAAHCGYHLREADLYFEIIDPQSGQVLPDGTYGEVVFSTLTRRGMPLIRYRMGDTSRFISGMCPCGSSLRLMERVSGRFENQIMLDGALIKLSALDEILFAIPGLVDFKISVEKENEKTNLLLETVLLSERYGKIHIEDALAVIPGLQQMQMHISCKVQPQYVPSLNKRVIVDHRVR